MTTETTELVPGPETGIVKFSTTQAVINQLKADYGSLTIDGIEDKAGLKRVYDARQEVKRIRVALGKEAKSMKESALEWQRKVIAAEKEILAEITPLEEHLQAEENRIEEEKAAIKRKAEEEKQAKLQERITRLAKYNFEAEPAQIAVISDQTFDGLEAHAKKMYEADQAEKERERIAQEEEKARIAAERKELEELRAKQAEAQRVIDEQNARIKAEQDAKEAALAAEKQRILDEENARIAAQKREQEIAKAREEAREEARIKAVKEAEEAERHRVAQEKAAKDEADRQAALQPDKVKLLILAKDVANFMTQPDHQFTLTDPKAKEIFDHVAFMMSKVETHIRQKVKFL